MSNTKIKSSQFHGVVGHGTDGYFLTTNGDGSMSWISNIVNPVISSLSYPGSATAADPAGGETITITGTGFKTGATVTVGGTAAPSVSYVSATSLTITTPAKTAGDYDVVVTNTDGGTATSVNGISFNGIPSWTTAAGTLGTFASDTTISTITLQASEPDAGTITFSITNGALPTGLSLTGADIDGTTTLETADTLYTFTVTATDDETQTTPRTFTITVTKQFISTENFTINTYTGNGSTQSIEGKIGTAASFNGSSSQIVVSTIANIKSYSFWINAGNIGSNYGKRLFGLDSSGYTNCITYTGNSSSSVGVVDGSGNTYYSATVSDNNWHHIVVTTNGTDTLKIYTDGNLSSTNSTSYFTSSFTHIGSDNTNRQFGGKLDQIRIFNKELSSTEVTTLYGESNTSTTKSTTDIFNDGSGVALYEFEEGAKDTGGVTGYIGSGGIFNGSSSKIDLGNNSSNNSSVISVSLWFKTSGHSGTATIINNGGANGSETGYYLGLTSSGYLRFNATGIGHNDGSVNYADGSWHSVIMTLNNGAYNVYVDGNTTPVINGTGIFTSTATRPTWIGQFSYTSSNIEFFNGSIDQVRIFDKALSSSEVTTLYGETSASSTKSTTDIFSDSSGIALYELEGSANDTGGVTGRTSGTEAAVFTNADNSSLNLGNARVVNNSFGVSFWVKMNKISQSENVYLCSFMYGSNTSLYMDTNNVLQVSNGGYSRNESFSTTHAFAVDTWYHIVYTGQIAGDSTLRCYVNGTQVGSRGWISGHNYTVTSGNTIGSYNNADNSIDGNIADFRIYKSTYLSASDVTALYSGTPPTTGLTEFYSFNGNDTDAQGNRTLTASNVIYNYNGTATNVLYDYDGTPTNVSFVGTSFQPDLVWIKNRNANSDPIIQDTVRGITKLLETDGTAAESNNSVFGHVDSVESNGFTVDSGGGTEENANKSGRNYVAWCWKAGGAAVSNTDGSITSTVKANQDAGFSIVSYTGSGSNASFGHSLSQTPSLVIVKRTSATEDWFVLYDTTNTPPNYMKLNATSTGGTSSGVFPSPATSSVVNIGNNTATNASSSTYIAYCFTSITGYQKIGSYTGNGSSGGQTITGLGFNPRFLLVKNATSSAAWRITDSARGDNIYLYPNLSNADDSSSGYISLITDGFRMNGLDSNTSDTFIYLAIA